MSTYQEVADLARLPLNDVDKVRFTDEVLHTYAVHGMQSIFKRRADLFVGQLATPPLITDLIGDAFPINDQYLQTLADWVVARASTHSDEHISTGRAKLFAEIFGGEMQ